ncbi:paraquat-inducible membrane protein A [Caminibacter mediatlanticus TB-2]|uniref:Paraquat-inducible membrane protein A n=1 Tax=Caminibacter mediatlanticus TB-2 TaxID=391592 RepID=A0AAI9F2P0_9BACT|nr:paraquat-inducible protein A [Caminibacter mediatlanticus]EDM23960.1 paraquat-inducible protein A [Caminibacter mediatlanticus TB-2]QCT94326.1 paraquat-inducible membrane protein A [Caminibacter mediatlanticus TB-2]
MIIYKVCPKCGAVNKKTSKRCYRCGFKLEYDINLSLSLAISGLIFYIPANLYPIIQTNKFFTSTSNTIIDGIFLLWQKGDYPIAIIVFLASVLIPILKFIIIFYLIFSIKFRSCKFLNLKKRFYKFIKATGHWSLLDVFVVIVLSGLINSQNVSIIPREGAIYFLLMVIFTILSSMTLDISKLGEECG